jgi:hypothetical protein
MERSGKRGKIPQQDWPSIMARYESGETLASIARTYDCSPPAISYIVNRSRARSAAPAPAAPNALIPGETQLVKGHAVQEPVPDAPQSERIGDGSHAGNLSLDIRHRVEKPAVEEPRPGTSSFSDEAASPSNPQTGSSLQEGDRLPGRSDSPQADANQTESADSPRSVNRSGTPAQNDEPRRTLHLSLSHGSNPSPGPELPSPTPQRASISGDEVAPSPAGSHRSLAPLDRQVAGYNPPAGNGTAGRMTSEPPIPKDGRAFIDQALRERVESDIAVFLAAFDAALTDDTAESRAGLREATDRLLRAGARTRIELERLEARVPLTSRNDSRQQEPAWRQR